MKLTCVTATFNAIAAGNRDRLIRCVKSVAALKTEHEHLIYDGASTDGTVELLRELEAKTPGLKVVSEPDTGIYNALNKGVRDAQGEWFYVLGCDDCICNPDVMDGIVGNSYPVGVVATDVVEGDLCVGKFRRLNPANVLRATPYCHQGVLMRLEVVRRFGGFDELYRIAADYKLLLQCHLSGVAIKLLSGDDYLFACFGMEGLSETNLDVAHREFDSVLSEMFVLKPTKMASYRERRFLPVRIFSRFLFSRNFSLKVSSRKMLHAWLLYYLRKPLYPLVVITRPIRCMI